MASGSRDVNDLKVAMVRPYGYHFLDVYINEMYSPLSKIKYITADFNMEEWNWLKLTKIEPVKLSVRPTFLFDPFFLRRGAYGIFSIARLIGMEKAMEGTDVVDTSEITTSFSYQAAKLSTKLNVPLITSVIETIPHHISTLIPPYSHYAKFVLKKTDAFIALTKRSEIFLKRTGANNEAVNLLRPGIDTSLFHPGSRMTTRRLKSYSSVLCQRIRVSMTCLRHAVLCQKITRIWNLGMWSRYYDAFHKVLRQTSSDRMSWLSPLGKGAGSVQEL